MVVIKVTYVRQRYVIVHITLNPYQYRLFNYINIINRIFISSFCYLYFFFINDLIVFYYNSVGRFTKFHYLTQRKNYYKWMLFTGTYIFTTNRPTDEHLYFSVEYYVFMYKRTPLIHTYVRYIYTCTYIKVTYKPEASNCRNLSVHGWFTESTRSGYGVRRGSTQHARDVRPACRVSRTRHGCC